MDTGKFPSTLERFGQLELNWFTWLFRFWPLQPRPCPLAEKFKESREYLDMSVDEASKLLGIPADEIKKFELGL